MRKRGGKIGDSINKNPPNSMRKHGGKPIVYCFTGGEKPPKSNWKNGEENQVLILIDYLRIGTRDC